MSQTLGLSQVRGHSRNGSHLHSWCDYDTGQTDTTGLIFSVIRCVLSAPWWEFEVKEEIWWKYFHISSEGWGSTGVLVCLNCAQIAHAALVLYDPRQIQSCLRKPLGCFHYISVLLQVHKLSVFLPFCPVPVTPLFLVFFHLPDLCVCVSLCACARVCTCCLLLYMCVCFLLPAPLRKAKFVESPRIPQSELGSPTHTSTTAKNPDLDTYCPGKFLASSTHILLCYFIHVCSSLWMQQGDTEDWEMGRIVLVDHLFCRLLERQKHC